MKLKKANLTIECALIMPIILTVIISLIWLTVYLYDMGVAQTAMIHGLLVSDYNPNVTNSSLCDSIKAGIEEESAPYLVGITDCSVSTKVKQRRCLAEMTIQMNIPDSAPIIGQLTTNTMEYSHTRLSGAYVIRDTRRIKGMYEFYKTILNDHGLIEDDGGYDGSKLQEGS